jgi:hypothetical protein
MHPQTALARAHRSNYLLVSPWTAPGTFTWLINSITVSAK